MYEQILKWSVETLTSFAKSKGEQQAAIIMEAVKLKNDLISERFKTTCAIADKISLLCTQIDPEQEPWRSTQSGDEKKTLAQFRQYLKDDYHKANYRQLKSIRSGLEVSNDLIAAYSKVMIELLGFGKIELIIKTRGSQRIGEYARNYRNLWILYSEIIFRLIRITSGDIRFWATDKPYTELAEEFARNDLESLTTFLRTTKASHNQPCLFIDRAEGLNEFWVKFEQR